MASKLEKKFQKELIDELHEMFPGCMVLKNDPDYIQGIPDLTVFYGPHWATLECKRETDANRQPNQPYYVNKMNEMSFSRFIYPENKETVLHELQSAFRT